MPIRDKDKILESTLSVQSGARDYIRRGWPVIPVPHGEKKPIVSGWPDLRITEADLPKYFADGQNIGVILGEASGDLVDVDLDSAEGITLAPSFLPETESTFGRRSKPESHWLFVTDPIPASERFLDPEDGTSLIELRSTGCQTIFPPSEHSSERVEWARNGEPRRISGSFLRASVARLAGAVLLARHWPKRGSRQDAALALAGGLLRHGWSEADVSTFIAAVAKAAGDDESQKRATAGAFTERRLSGRRAATGWPRLGKVLGERVTARVRGWLGESAPHDDALPRVDGPPLLRQVEAFCSRFLVLPQGVPFVLALWTLGTHTFRPFGSEPEDIFDCFPFLAINSPIKRCGKTRVGEILSLLAARADRCVASTEAAIFRSIKAERPTLILDEAEVLHGKSERAEAVRAILNAGNRGGITVPRCVGDSNRLERFPVYSPKVIIAIGQLPDTIRDRSIVISMQRKAPHEAIASFKIRRVQAEATTLRETIAAFIKKETPRIQEAYNSADIGFLQDREAEGWEPLFALLEVIDPSRRDELREGALRLANEKSATDIDESLSLHLLTDIRAAMDGQPQMLTRDLLEQLKNRAESPWAVDCPLTDRKLARMLRPFEIVSRSVRIGNTTGKGYAGADFEPAFRRYLAPEGKNPSHPSQPAKIAAEIEFSEASQRLDVTDGKNGPDPHKQPLVTDVTLESPSGGTKVACRACGGGRFWLSVHGAEVCATCHPPAAPHLVAAWIGPEMIQ